MFTFIIPIPLKQLYLTIVSAIILLEGSASPARLALDIAASKGLKQSLVVKISRSQWINKKKEKGRHTEDTGRQKRGPKTTLYTTDLDPNW